MRILPILLALAFLGCRHGHHAEHAATPTDELAARQAGWLEALQAASDPATGWPSAADCDATLWAGLAAAGGAAWVRLELAEYPAAGHLQRRPEPACWADGDHGARSTVSRDMVVGWLWGTWARRDVGALQRLAAYGEAHRLGPAEFPIGWILGEPYPEEAARVVLTTNDIGLVGRMLASFGDKRSYRNLPSVYADVQEDYARHLQALSILLQGEARPLTQENGLLDIDDQEIARLRELANVSPRDALFQAALARYTGDFTAATELLIDDAYADPTYVRGAAVYGLIHRLFATKIVLGDGTHAP